MRHHVKHLSVTVFGVLLLLVIGISYYKSNTDLQKGSLRSAADSGLASCSALSATQCQNRTPECQLVSVTGVGQYCVNAGVSCSYTAPAVELTNNYVAPYGDAGSPFDLDHPNVNSRYTTIYFSLNAPSTVTAKIKQGETVVKNLVSGSAYDSRRNHTIVWNGTNDSQVKVAPGTYTYEVTATTAGGSRTVTGAIAVVRSALEITNLRVEPSSFDPLSQQAKVKFTLNKSVAGRVFVKYRSSRGVTTIFGYLNGSAGSNLNAGENELVWDGLDGNGNAVPAQTYIVELALENNGQTVTRTVNVTVVPPQQLAFTNYYVTPDRFSRSGTAQIKYTLNRNARVSVKIYEDRQPLGSVLKNLQLGQDVGAGSEASAAWDATNENAQVVPAGRYRYLIEAVSTRDLEGRNPRNKASIQGSVEVYVPCAGFTVRTRDVSDRSGTRYSHILENVGDYSGRFTWTAYPSNAFGISVNNNTRGAEVRPYGSIPQNATLVIDNQERSCMKTVNPATGTDVLPVAQTVVPTATVEVVPLQLATPPAPPATIQQPSKLQRLREGSRLPGGF